MEISKTKSIRFGKLVEKSGKPEVVTLWADPKCDRSFMELVKKKRVATIVQRPKGNKKDFGYVGFHPQPFAAFMVFPKPLSEDEGRPIIGIKYELLEAPGPSKRFEPKIIPFQKPVLKKPIEELFRVKILRTIRQHLIFDVKGLNASEAKTTALAAAEEVKLPAETNKVRNKIIAIELQ
jgi:hypothetical protein